MNAIVGYRIERWLYKHKLTLFAKLIRALIYLLHNSYIPYTAEINQGTKFGYKGIGVVIHSRAVIGKNCIIAQNVTIGGKSGCDEVPHIGNDCYIGAGAIILGNVRIGNGVIVGAGSVVLKDIPDGGIAVGVPAKVIKYKEF